MRNAAFFRTAAASGRFRLTSLIKSGAGVISLPSPGFFRVFVHESSPAENDASLQHLRRQFVHRFNIVVIVGEGLGFRTIFPDAREALR